MFSAPNFRFVRASIFIILLGFCKYLPNIFGNLGKSEILVSYVSRGRRRGRRVADAEVAIAGVPELFFSD